MKTVLKHGQCSLYQSTLGQRSMISFVVVSSDLRLTSVKNSGEERDWAFKWSHSGGWVEVGMSDEAPCQGDLHHTPGVPFRVSPWRLGITYVIDLACVDHLVIYYLIESQVWTHLLLKSRLHKVSWAFVRFYLYYPWWETNRKTIWNFWTRLIVCKTNHWLYSSF